MQFLAELDAYEIVTLEECQRQTNKRPIPVGWVDVNKGDQQRPSVRARLVVKETKYNSDLTDPSATFACTPPYESLRLLVSLAMSPSNDKEKYRTLMFLDITRAHPHCAVSRDLYIALPMEDPWSQTGLHCGKLKRCLYGTRDAGLQEGSKGAATPGVKEKDAEVGTPLSAEDSILYRSMTMRCNYLSQDRPEIGYAAKEAARHMANPNERGLEMTKRIARFLHKHPRVVQRMVQQ
eukprot:2018866-Amphidinium_carterae.2